MSLLNNIKSKISAYKKKLFFTLLLKGIGLFIFSFLSVFILTSVIEHIYYLNTDIKTLLFYFLCLFYLSILSIYVVYPFYRFINYNNFFSDEDAAKELGSKIKPINDKLLNILQLSVIPNNELALLSIKQKFDVISIYDFEKTISLKEYRRIFIAMAIPFIVFFFLMIINPQIITESSSRLINYKTSYQKPLPFSINLINKDLSVLENEDFEFLMKVEGNYLVDNAYIKIGNQKKKLTKLKDQIFSYRFSNNKKSQVFSLIIAGYESDEYVLNVLPVPSISDVAVSLNFPEYTGKERLNLSNLSNLTIPEGTKISWFINSKNTSTMNFIFDSSLVECRKEKNTFSLTKTINKSLFYSVLLQNENTSNRNNISYKIDVIKDAYPKILVEKIEDTSLYRFVVLSGEIADDYGFNDLNLKYRVLSKNGSGEKNYKSIKLPFNKKQTPQTFYHFWAIDSLLKSPDEKIEYFVEVFDNDGVNGSKSSRSSVYKFEFPDDISSKLNEESESFQKDVLKSINELKKEEKNLKNLEEKLKSKKELDWEEKKSIEKTLEKREQLMKNIEQLSKNFEELKKKQEKFNAQNESIKEKTEQLQSLMNELLDEKTKALMEELRKLLEDNKPNDQSIKDKLEEITRKDFNLEKELERTLELYKKLKLEQDLKNISDNLEKLSEEQKNVSEKTDTKEEQQNINEKFEDIKKDIENANELNKEINKNENIKNETKKETENIDKELDNTNKQLENNNKNKASQHQKNASEEMKELSKKMSEMANDNDMAQREEDLKTLRLILENLLTLSFNQENLMNTFKNIKQVNPQFVENSDQQIKIKNDSKIIEDSLLALANRNFEIKKFVTDELFEMNDKIDKSLDAIRTRTLNKITVNQQLAMTSMNNLALLLSDVVEQMQQQMAQNMEGNQQCSGNPKKPGKGNSLSQLQKELNDKIGELKKSGKTGRELSEELAKLAAEQEMIRNALNEMEKMQNKDPKSSGGNNPLKKLMEETEKELVNKKLLNNTLNRQEEILTRLLESEKAIREKEYNEKREAEHVKKNNPNIPPDIEKYLKEKEKQVELLKKTNNSYSIYYKNEVQEYLKSVTK